MTDIDLLRMLKSVAVKALASGLDSVAADFQGAAREADRRLTRARKRLGKIKRPRQPDEDGSEDT